LKCDGTNAETSFRLSAKRTSPFKWAGESVQPTGSRVVRNIASNAGYTMFRGRLKGTGYPLHSSVSSSLSLPCVTVCHHISTGVYVKNIYSEFTNVVLRNFRNKLRALVSLGSLVIAAKPKSEYGNITPDKLFYVLQHSGKIAVFKYELIC